LEPPPGICEVSSFHSFVPLRHTFQLDQLHLTTRTEGTAFPGVPRVPHYFNHWDHMRSDSKRHLDRFGDFAQLTTECRRACPDMSFPTKIGHSRGWSVALSNTWSLRSTRLSISNGISIGSAVFAQLAADSPYISQWAAPSHSPPKRVLLTGESGTTRVHNPNSISISSVVFCTDHRVVSLYYSMGRPSPS